VSDRSIILTPPLSLPSFFFFFFLLFLYFASLIYSFLSTTFVHTPHLRQTNLFSLCLFPHILPIGDRIATLKLQYATFHQIPPLTCLHSPASSLPPTPIFSHTCIPRAFPSMRGSHAPPPHSILFAHPHWSYRSMIFFGLACHFLTSPLQRPLLFCHRVLSTNVL
jgi:hypothetical protein